MFRQVRQMDLLGSYVKAAEELTASQLILAACQCLAGWWEDGWMDRRREDGRSWRRFLSIGVLFIFSCIYMLITLECREKEKVREHMDRQFRQMDQLGCYARVREIGSMPINVGREPTLLVAYQLAFFFY
jgi:hypothetical protein